jgi:hypothetical protein
MRGCITRYFPPGAELWRSAVTPRQEKNADRVSRAGHKLEEVLARILLLKKVTR